MKYKAPIRPANDPKAIFKIGGGWGNSVKWWNWDDRRVTGWKIPRPLIGDVLLADMKSGKTMRFEFVDVDWESDPTDMFWGVVKELGYEE